MEKSRHFRLICFKHSYANICIVTIVKFMVLKTLLTLNSVKFVFRFGEFVITRTVKNLHVSHFKDNFVIKPFFKYLFESFSIIIK